MYRNQVMTRRRADFGAVIDGLLLSVPLVLLSTIIPWHAVRIAIDWTFDQGLDPLPLALISILAFAPLGLLADLFFFRTGPFGMTPAKLLMILLITLVAIALAVIEMKFVSS